MTSLSQDYTQDTFLKYILCFPTPQIYSAFPV